MDASRFDAYARSFAPRSSSRREWLAKLIALSAVLPLMLTGETVDAKRKKRHRHHKKKRRQPEPSCTPTCTGLDCAPDGCGGTCSCDGVGVCDAPDGTCCNPEGAPCTSFEGCCSQTCDSLVGGGTCAPCAGRSCSADRPCCGELECISGYCDGCRDRATYCTSPSQCCFSDCVSYSCLSKLGGRCARDVDCRACYLGGTCTNACVAGACAV